MQSFNFRTGMVVGSAGPSVWSQVVVRPLTLSSYLAILVKIEHPEGGELLSLSQVGTELLESMKEKLQFAHNHNELRQLLMECLKEMDIELNVSVGAMLFSSDQVYLTALGDVEVYILRDKKIGRLVASNEAKTGKSLPGDYFVLTTVQVPSGVGLEKWREIMLAGMSGVDQLAVDVHGRSKNGDYAVVAVERQQQDNTLKTELNWGGMRELVSRLWQKPLLIRQEQLKFNAWIGGGLTLLLFFGVIIGVVRRTQVVKERTFQNMVSVVTQRISEARSVGDLNPERAKYLLNSVKDEVKNYEEKTKEDKYIEEANKLLIQVAQAESEIFKKEEVTTNILIEAKVLTANFDPEIMIMNQKSNIFLAESSVTEVWGVSLSDKSSWKISPNDIKAVKDVASYNGKLFILNDEGVYSADEKKSLTKREIEPDDLWSSPRFIDQYAGNVYVLDKGQGEIWKYPVLSDGFGARRRWLAPGIELDLSNVTDMALDGDIWLITSTGKLERYRRGVPVVFPMEAFPYVEQGKLSVPTSIYLSDNKVYVAENGAKRIVVFDKESGKYENQYVNEEFAKIKSIVVDKGKCYALVDDRIIWFEL